MVDKADSLQLDSVRQAGVGDLKIWFPNLRVPEGITLADLEAAESLVFDSQDEGEPRKLVLCVAIYELLASAVEKSRQQAEKEAS